MISPCILRARKRIDDGSAEMGSGAGGLEDSQLERLETDVIRFMA